MKSSFHNRSRRSVTALVAFALSTTSLGVLASAAYAQAPPGLGDIVVTPGPGGPPITAAPSPTLPPAQYKVEAQKFYVDAESGDWGGSDEPYWIFSTSGASAMNETTKSHTFSNVDQGETRTFSKSEGCLFKADCTGAAAPYGIGMSIQLWEADSKSASDVLDTTSKALAATAAVSAALPVTTWVAGAAGAVSKACSFLSGWLEDDLLGTQTFTYSPQLLANKLPTVGSSFLDARTFSGSDPLGARYELVLKVSRVG